MLALALAAAPAVAAPRRGQGRGSPPAADTAGAPAAPAAGQVEDTASPRTIRGVMPGPIRFKRLGSDDGLPSMGVYAIVQDRDGLMWFATLSGLARYDGQKARVFVHQPEKPTSLPSNDVTSLTLDADGRLWVGTGGGLRRYDSTTESFVGLTAPGAAEGEPDESGEGEEKPKPPLSVPIARLFVDSKNRLWVGFADGGAARVDPRTQAVDALPALREAAITAIAERADGAILFGTDGDGLVVYDGGQDRTLSAYTAAGESGARLPSNDVTSILVERSGRMWVGTEQDGVVAIRDERPVYYRHDKRVPSSLSSDQVTAIFAGPNDSIWIGTRTGGLNQFDEPRGRFVRHIGNASDESRLSDSWVTTAGASRDGVTWIGTLQGGVCFFDGLSLELRYYRTGSVAITAVAEDRRQPDIVWMGTGAGAENGGLYQLDRRTGEYTIHKRLGPETDPMQLDQHWIAALHSDDKGTLWIATHGMGLLEYRTDKEVLVSHKVSEEKEELGNVQAILPNPDGTFWLGLWGEGLARLDPRTDRVDYFGSDEKDPSSLGGSHVYALARDAANPKVLWVATGEGGLTRFDTATETGQRFAHDDARKDSLSNNAVTSVQQDRSGQLWLGTVGGGLNRFDPRTGKFTRYDRPEHPTTVWGIAEDASGLVWLATEGAGLRVLDPRSGRMVGYGARDGLQADEFAQGGQHVGASGTFYFGGVNGMSALRPERVKPDAFTPPLRLTGFRVFDEPRPLGEGAIELSYLDSVVSFQFGSSAYADPGRIRYEVQLEGLYDGWIPAERGSASYTSLDPGDYVFRLRATGRHGAQSTLAVPIHVSPPPWLTWWAFVLYVLAVVGAAFGFVRYQRRKLALLHQETRLATVERELELTAAVQTGFLPDDNHISMDRFGLVGVYRPAGQCGGDWWWHEKVNGHHLIAVGDVTGHGPGPAMVTASVSTTFRVMRQIWQESGPSEFLRIANEQVVKSGRGQYLMQIMIAEFDPGRGKVSFYSAAGFPAVCLIGGTTRVVTAPGVPLGTPDFKVSVQEVDLAPGDRFMLLSDGIPEIEMTNGRRLGLRKVIKLYEETATMPLPGAADHLLNAARTANLHREQEDDWTFVIAEWARQ
jgi:ligand-binding sensor domain-containing protein/serine phosphatase RsbU (regulator of sigma subunit)